MDHGLLSLKWNNHSSTFFHILENIRKKELYNDVTLACDGKFFPVHKLVLSTCSDYFQEIFEKTQCKHPIIVLKDINHQDLESLLNYMYIGEVNVIQNELSSLIKAAECLRVRGLAVPDEPPPSKKSHKRLNVPEKDVNQVTPTKRYRKREGINNVLEEVKMDTTSNKIQDIGVEERSIAKEIAEVNIKDEQIEAEDHTEVKNENYDDETAEAVSGSDDLINSYTGDSNSQFPTTSCYEDQWPGDIETIDDDDYGDMSAFDQLDPSQLADPSQANSLQTNRLHQMKQKHMLLTASYENYMKKLEDSRWKCCYEEFKCSYIARSRYDVVKHIRARHLGEKPFSCTFCLYRSSEKSNLYKHVKSQHSLNYL